AGAAVAAGAPALLASAAASAAVAAAFCAVAASAAAVFAEVAAALASAAVLSAFGWQAATERAATATPATSSLRSSWEVIEGFLWMAVQVCGGLGPPWPDEPALRPKPHALGRNMRR